MFVAYQFQNFNFKRYFTLKIELRLTKSYCFKFYVVNRSNNIFIIFYTDIYSFDINKMKLCTSELFRLSQFNLFLFNLSTISVSLITSNSTFKCLLNLEGNRIWKPKNLNWIRTAYFGKQSGEVDFIVVANIELLVNWIIWITNKIHELDRIHQWR